MTTEKRQLADFHQIQIGSAFKIDAKVGPATSFSVTAPADIMNRIKSNVENGKLIVSIEGSVNINGRMSITLTTPKLDAAEISGACELDLKGVDSPKFDLGLSGSTNAKIDGKADDISIDLSGASNLNWPNIKASKATLTSSGASKVELGGTANQFNVESSGASNIRARNLQSDSVTVNGSGASDISVFASKAITGEASGATSVHYSGGASSVNVSTSGGSNISRN